jgi:hypothetical protein
VQDLAALHVAVIIDPEVEKGRLHSRENTANFNSILAVALELRPQRKLFPDWPENYCHPLNADQTESVAMLKQWTGQWLQAVPVELSLRRLRTLLYGLSKG